MSPQEVGDLVVQIKADTRGFDRAMRRVQRQLWWMEWGAWLVIAIPFVLGIVIGLVVGVVAS